MLGAVAIGLQGVRNKESGSKMLPSDIPDDPDDGLLYRPSIRDPSYGTGIAILWGFITPCFFLIQSFYTKYVTSEKYNFHAYTISLGTSSFTSFLVLILGVTWYWPYVAPFNLKLFLIGIVGSILDTIGKSFI